MSLVAHWLFNDGSGTTAADATGHGHAGALSGCAWVSSGLGGAIEMDGVDDSISVADHADLRLAGDMSIALWMKSTSARQDWMRVLGKGTRELRTYGLWVEHETNYLVFQQYDGVNYNVQLRHVISPDTWYHVVVTIGGSTCKLYVDNSVVATATRSGTPPSPTESLVMGYVSDAGWSSYFAGRLDDVRIYDNELSSGDVNTIFTAGTP